MKRIKNNRETHAADAREKKIILINFRREKRREKEKMKEKEKKVEKKIEGGQTEMSVKSGVIAEAKTRETVHADSIP